MSAWTRSWRLLLLPLVCTLAVGACSDDEGPGAITPPTDVPDEAGTAPFERDDAGGDAQEEASAAPSLALTFDTVASGFKQPIDILAFKGRLYVAEQRGLLKVADPGGSAHETLLDISSRVTLDYDQGLLGFALHPKFPDKPYLYVTYTAPYPTEPKPEGVVYLSVIARFESLDGGVTFDASSEKRLLTWDHPHLNHANNSVVFGPDGYLYIASGDSGQGGQNTDTLFGTILRIDVDDGDPYGIPPSNPFASGGGRPEIYAWGFRNPWRFEFDPISKRMFVGDVGLFDWEEINEVLPGRNYGWPHREGRVCSTLDAGPCDGGVYEEPLLVHDHTEAAAITGGVIYRGALIPEFRGKYVYCDASSGWWWIATLDGPTPTTTRIYDPLPQAERRRGVSIRADEDGEILAALYREGRVVRVGKK